MSYPHDYTAQFVYSDCNKLKIAGSTYHQVLRITTDQWTGSDPDYGSGTFRLSFGDYWATTCLGYGITIVDLKAALEATGVLSARGYMLKSMSTSLGHTPMAIRMLRRYSYLL